MSRPRDRARYASPKNLLTSDRYVVRARDQVCLALITLAECEHQNNDEHLNTGSRVAQHCRFFTHFSTFHHISRRRSHSTNIAGASEEEKGETEIGQISESLFKTCERRAHRSTATFTLSVPVIETTELTGPTRPVPRSSVTYQVRRHHLATSSAGFYTSLVLYVDLIPHSRAWSRPAMDRFGFIIDTCRSDRRLPFSEKSLLSCRGIDRER